MFPINWNDSFRKKDGTLVNMEDMGGGGGGSSFTPDYENEILVIGTVGDWKYFIPMSKEYVGSGITGYEIETNPDSTSSAAKIDIYQIIYTDGEIVYKELIKTLVHNGDKDYEDDNLSVTYIGSSWTVTTKVPLYDVEGTAYVSPVTWSYNTTVDYVMLTEDPT